MDGDNLRIKLEHKHGRFMMNEQRKNQADQRHQKGGSKFGDSGFGARGIELGLIFTVF